MKEKKSDKIVCSIMNKINVRSVVVLLLVLGALSLAVLDEKFRPVFGDLAKVGVGGYLGQLLPEKRGDSM